MLDVARHFFGVDDVLRFIDLAALYKLNVLHLHLTDDQGWRIEIPAWPRLTVGRAPRPRSAAAPGGFYTQADYARIVAHAGVAPRSRSCRRSTCPATSTPRWSRTPSCGGGERAGAVHDLVARPGTRSTCGSEIVLRFLDDVVGELAR